MRDDLIFAGLKYGQAKVEEIEPRTSDRPPLFRISSRVEGKPFTLRGPKAWWRDFSGIPWEADQIQRFVRKHGLATIVPGSDAPRVETTEGWNEIQETFQLLGRAWTPFDDKDLWALSEISDASAFEPTEILRSLLDDLRGAPDPDGPPGSQVFKARTLVSFMAMSLMAGLEARQPMRRCETCGEWFYRTRVDQRFDSNSCRANYRFWEAMRKGVTVG